MKKFVIIGGGAAGYFAAINSAEANPKLEVIILESGSKVLEKVKVSGGGRCNVTHACFNPKALVKFYPRGEKELLGPFYQFSPTETMQWFEDRGVALKIEDDNRVFPQSDTSQSIIDCLTQNALKARVKLLTKQRVEAIYKIQDQFKIETSESSFIADFLLIATGSSPNMFPIIEKLGHKIITPVPSLFTFNIKDQRLTDLLGVSVPYGEVKILNTKLKAEGPILITHWGLSGPGILKLSAWGALLLHQKNYQFDIEINWVFKKPERVLELLKQYKTEQPKKLIVLKAPFDNLPKRLWERLVLAAGMSEQMTWAQVSLKQLQQLVLQLCESRFTVNGKSTFKAEFVTAGGVDLKSINFKRFESKLHPNLFFAGEVLNIDALTGGFNFQNAWTGSWIVAQSL